MKLLDAIKDYRDSRRDERDGYTLLSREDVQASVKRASQLEFNRGWGGWDNSGTGWNRGGTDSLNRNDVKLSNELGDVRFISLIVGAVRWAARNFTDARFNVVQVDNDRKEKEIAGHELTDLFKRPNPYYSGLTFWCGMMLSNICRGEMHALKVRSGAGRVVELWYQPYWNIKPVWNQSGKEFISHYEYYVNGRWVKWGNDANDVFVVYDIGLDPDTRRGMLNATASLVHEFFTDKQLARFLGSLFQRGLMPPAFISVGDKDTPAPTGPAWNALKGDIERHFSDPERIARPFVSSGPLEATQTTVDYSGFGFDVIRDGIEARFAAAMGISVISLMLNAGLKHSAYANVKEYHTHDYRSYIVPLHKLVSAEIDHQLLPEYGNSAGIESRWDYSEVAVMQRDRMEVAKETEILVRSRVISQDEARERHSYKPVVESQPKGEPVWFPLPQTNVTISPMDQAEPPSEELLVKPNGHTTMTDDEMKAAKMPSDSEIDGYASHWSEVAPEGAKGLFEAKPS